MSESDRVAERALSAALAAEGIPLPAALACASARGARKECGVNYIGPMSAPVTRAAEGMARRAFTVAEVERMVSAGIIPEDERLEILGGKIVPMSPKGDRHEAIKVELNRLLGQVCPDDFAFAPETGLTLDKDTYLEPDFIVFGRSVPLAVVKGPDVLLAVEVADSSLDYNHRPEAADLCRARCPGTVGDRREGPAGAYPLRAWTWRICLERNARRGGPLGASVCSRGARLRARRSQAGLSLITTIARGGPACYLSADAGFDRR